MEKQIPTEPEKCQKLRVKFTEFLAGTLVAEESQRLREHLLDCQACTLEFGRVQEETATPEELAQFYRPMPRPPTSALKVFGIQSDQEGTVWTALQSFDAEQIPWVQEAQDAVRTAFKAFQGAVLLLMVASATKGRNVSDAQARSIGAKREREEDARQVKVRVWLQQLDIEETWPQILDVELVNVSGQKQGRTVRFELSEPPTLTHAGEFVAALRTEDPDCAGGSLRCTLSLEERGEKVTFAGTIQPALDGQGWTAQIRATGLPSFEEVEADELTTYQDVVIPVKCVEWAVQERPQSSVEAVAGRAVIIGINHYVDEVHHPRLPCCLRDAVGMYLTLTHPDYCALDPDQVILMLDGTDAEVRAAVQTVSQRLVQDRGISAQPGLIEKIVEKRLVPEREEIVATIQLAAYSSTFEDALFLYFAGHGHVSDNEVFLVPPRTRHPLYFWTAIPLRQIKAILRQSRAQDKVFFLDCCYSGAETERTTTTIPNEQLRAALSSGVDDFVLFTACLPWEQSFEHRDEKGGPVHSIFTASLIEGLSGTVDTLPRGMTLEDLSQHVIDRVKAWVNRNTTEEKGNTQTPSLYARDPQQILLSKRSRKIQKDSLEQRSLPFASVETIPLSVRVWVQMSTMPSISNGDAPLPRLGNPTFKVDQGIRLGFSVNRDAYLYLLDVDTQGTVTIIFPNENEEDQENHVIGRYRHFLPKETAADFPVQGPPGVETVIAIATVRPAPFLSEWLQAGLESISEQDLIHLSQALSVLPDGQWALGHYQFVIRE